jgi:hypothetical protein
MYYRDCHSLTTNTVFINTKIQSIVVKAQQLFFCHFHSKLSSVFITVSYLESLWVDSAEF